MAQPSSSKTLRQTTRQVISHNELGKSIFVQSPDLLFQERGNAAVARKYAVGDMPAKLDEAQDVKAYLSPDSQEHPSSHSGSAIVAPNGVNSLQVDVPPAAESPMHRTVSIDYVTVVEGEVILELDSGEKTLLKAGDSIVQRGTMHRWINASSERPARFVATTVACESFNVAGKPIEEGFLSKI